MKKLALISTLLLAASPAAAQLVTSQRVQQLNGQSVQSTPTVAPTTGVFCIEEMTATFCNVTTGPNTSGYGSRGVSTSRSGAASSGVSASSGGAGAISPSIPPYSSEPPFNELCN
jgi:hypothetical protein